MFYKLSIIVLLIVSHIGCSKSASKVQTTNDKDTENISWGWSDENGKHFLELEALTTKDGSQINPKGWNREWQILVKKSIIDFIDSQPHHDQDAVVIGIIRSWGESEVLSSAKKGKNLLDGCVSESSFDQYVMNSFADNINRMYDGSYTFIAVKSDQAWIAYIGSPEDLPNNSNAYDKEVWNCIKQKFEFE